jgi:hypothetical protein
MHPCIFDISNPVQTQVRISFTQKYWSYSDSIGRDIADGKLNLSDVIDESRD